MDDDLIDFEDTELWDQPELGSDASPFIAFEKHRCPRPRNRYPTGHVDIWNTLNADEQAPYVAQCASALADYEARIKGFNANLPLSPLVKASGPHYNPDRWYDSQQRYRRRGTQLWNRYRRDHPEACGGAMTPVLDRPFRFLALPQELRAMILRLLLYRSTSIIQMEANGTAVEYDTSTDEGPIDVRIFATCKQVYQEATDAFFTHNLVQLNLGENLLLPILRPGSSQAAMIHKLKRVEVRLPLYKLGEAARVDWFLERACQILATKAQLMEVRIVPFSPGSWYVPAMHAVMDQVLEKSTILRGVSRVFLPAQDDLAMFMKQSDSQPNVVLGSEEQRQRLRSSMSTTGDERAQLSDLVAMIA